MSTSCALDRFKNLSSHEKSLYKIVHQLYRFFNVIYVIHHILDSSFSKRDRKTNFILYHLKKTEIMHTIGQFFVYNLQKDLLSGLNFCSYTGIITEILSNHDHIVYQGSNFS